MTLGTNGTCTSFFVAHCQTAKVETRKIHGKHCQTPLFHPVFVDTSFRFSPLALVFVEVFRLKNEKNGISSSTGWSISSSSDGVGPSGPNSRILAFSWDKSKRNLQVPRDQMETTRQDFSVTFNVSCLENIGKAPFVFF